MGGGQSQVANPNAGKPFFFLASCPPDCLGEAVEVTQKYGGFHCVGGDTGASSFGSKAPYAAWKLRAEAQFMTLKQLAPAGQKIFGVAIAGFGQTNDERQFLGQMHLKQGHEQFSLKQCGDVEDMERWLQFQGYLPVPAGAAPREEREAPAPPAGAEAFRADPRGPPVATRGARLAAPEAVPQKPEGVWATATSAVEVAPRKPAMDGAGGEREQNVQQGVWASIFGTQRPEEGQRGLQERLLGDVDRLTEESFDVDTSSVEALRSMQDRLSAALQSAADAGVIGDDLHDAEVRVQELSRLVVAAEEAQRGCCWRMCCCCCIWCCPRTTSARPEEVAALVTADVNAGHGSPARKEAAFPEPGPPGGLRPGTRCRYFSSSWRTFMPTTIMRFNPEDGTYDLQVRPHANVANIAPDPTVSAAGAWPPGTLVEYESSSANGRLAAVVVAYNPPATYGAEGSYNLDVREQAPVDRIRLRLK